MIRNNIIRKITAGFILILFAFCITPKKILHDLVANHKDIALTNSSVPQILHGGFHCNIDDLVVVSPFQDASVPFEIKVFSTSVTYNSCPVVTAHVNELFYSGLRGPPFSCC